MESYSNYYYELIEKYKLFHKNGVKNQPGFSTFLGYSLSKWIVKIKEIIETSNSNSLIDFGCGKGFLYNNKFKIGDNEFKNLSDFWDIENIFLYDPGVDKFSTYPNKRFDGIICTDVIEHIPEPDKCIKIIKERLSKNGRIIFVFPNRKSFWQRIAGIKWINWHIPYHLHHFNKKNFQKMIENSG